MLNKLGFLACGALFVVGCGSSDAASSSDNAATVRLQATVANRTLDNARAVAVASDGAKYWAYVDPSGRFTLGLPSGKSYRILLVNAVRNAPGRVSGQLVIRTSAGDKRWIGIDGSSKVVNLGSVSPIAMTATAVGTRSEGSSSSAEGTASEGKDEHAADPETHESGEHEDEHAKACTDHDGKDDKDDASDDDVVDLHPSNEPGDRCKDEHERDHEDAEGREKEDDDDHACSAPAPGGGGTAPAPTSPAPAPAANPAPVGAVQLGGVCDVNADCAGGLTCSASTCVLLVR